MKNMTVEIHLKNEKDGITSHGNTSGGGVLVSWKNEAENTSRTHCKHLRKTSAVYRIPASPLSRAQVGPWFPVPAANRCGHVTEFCPMSARGGAGPLADRGPASFRYSLPLFGEKDIIK